MFTILTETCSRAAAEGNIRSRGLLEVCLPVCVRAKPSFRRETTYVRVVPRSELRFLIERPFCALAVFHLTDVRPEKTLTIV